MNSLLELLAAQRNSKADYVAVAVDGTAEHLPFAHLYEVSKAAAAVLTEITGPAPAATGVVVAVADPLAFVRAFFGVLAAGLTPIPAPAKWDSNPAHRRRFGTMLETSKPVLVLTDRHRVDTVQDFCGDTCPQVLAVEELTGSAVGAPVFSAGGDDVAYVQYTSGSTADPRPAELTHARVIAQLRQAAAAYAESPDSVSVNWVPLYHDMGLVTSLLRPLFSGYRSVILDAGDFIRRPAFWPEQMTRWSATHTSAPDFGYAVTARNPGDISTWDLSRLRVARSAGELVRASTLETFSHVFGRAGFRSAAFCPSYGLAEAVLTVTTCPAMQEYRLVEVSRAALRRDVVAEPDRPDEALRLVSAGPPVAGTTVRVLDANGEPIIDERHVGEVWISGPQVVAHAGHTVGGVAGFRTGDLGFIDSGELVPLGRSGERFQIRGVNYYSGEVEAAVANSDPRFRAGRIVTFLSGDADDERRLVVVAEVRREVPLTGAELAELSGLIVTTVSRTVGVSVQVPAIVPAGTLPLTTSGKLRRAQCRSMFESGQLAAS